MIKNILYVTDNSVGAVLTAIGTAPAKGRFAILNYIVAPIASRWISGQRQQSLLQNITALMR